MAAKNFSMGCSVPYQPSDPCPHGPELREGGVLTELRFFNVSLVSINDDLVCKVAARCGTTEERVRAYLDNKDDQDGDLLRAFLFYGVGPINKTFDPTPRQM